MKSLDQYWYSQNIIAWSLLPLSLCFRVLAGLRRWLYKASILPSTRLPVPVIVVGNISVGGTGKTPLLIALCELLKTSGYRPGVISRGYASSVISEALVSEESTAARVGDEPMLIAKRTGCPVAVGRKRTAAARLLLQNSDCNVILSDDGLQHYALQRDIEIAVVDAARRHGNGFLLPAGPLREPVSRLNSVDMVVFNGAADADYNFNLEFLTAVNIATGEQVGLESFSATTVHAVAGIGHPQRFFDQLGRAGLKIIAHAFPDHHPYSAGDLDFGDSLPVLMTEKDAVKCDRVQLGTLWAIPVIARLSPQVRDDFLKSISRSIAVT